MSAMLTMLAGILGAGLLRGSVDLLAPKETSRRRFAAFACLYVGGFAMIKAFA